MDRFEFSSNIKITATPFYILYTVYMSFPMMKCTRIGKIYYQFIISQPRRKLNWSSSLIFLPFEHFAPQTREQRSLTHNYKHFIGVGAVSGQ